MVGGSSGYWDARFSSYPDRRAVPTRYWRQWGGLLLTRRLLPSFSSPLHRSPFRSIPNDALVVMESHKNYEHPRRTHWSWPSNEPRGSRDQPRETRIPRIVFFADESFLDLGLPLPTSTLLSSIRGSSPGTRATHGFLSNCSLISGPVLSSEKHRSAD